MTAIYLTKVLSWCLGITTAVRMKLNSSLTTDNNQGISFMLQRLSEVSAEYFQARQKPTPLFENARVKREIELFGVLDDLFHFGMIWVHHVVFITR